MFPSYISQSVDCRANQLTGFYMMGTLVVKGLEQIFQSYAKELLVADLGTE